ncbi:trypco2 family protein [Streptomyces pseudogriseolus]|uniref:trypco2 family protein n=1 Tax=Streptomyces pseudogriseolus TaxID=36817 RepID=UPI001CE27197|nr:trypco2 family protein [Streptomyces pseudogriseolus]
MTKVTLSEALAELRSELYKAADASPNEQFRFEVEQAELCLEVEFRKDGNGKVNVEVGALGTKGAVEAGGGGGTTHRQTLTLTLNVRDEALGGQTARIRRHSAPGEEPGADTPPGSDA